MITSSLTQEQTLVKTGPATWVVIDPADQADLVALAPALYAELTRRVNTAAFFQTPSGAWQGEEFVAGQGGLMASVMIIRKEIHLHLFTRTTSYGRLRLATRQAANVYDIHFNLGTWQQFIGQYLPAADEPAPAPLSPAARIAADIQAEFGTDFGGRLGRALELVEAGRTEFNEYKTGWKPGFVRTRECDCEDARYRAPRMKGIGCCCKHCLAQLIDYRLKSEAEAVAGRKAIDKIERRHGLPSPRRGGAGGEVDPDFGSIPSRPTGEYQRRLEN